MLAKPDVNIDQVVSKGNPETVMGHVRSLAPDKTRRKKADAQASLAVHCDTSDEIKRAKEIMKNTHAEDISSTGEARADSNTTDRDVASKTAGTTL